MSLHIPSSTSKLNSQRLISTTKHIRVDGTKNSVGKEAMDVMPGILGHIIAIWSPSREAYLPRTSHG